MSVELPEGWESTSLGSILVLQYGTSLTKATRRNGSVPVYGSAGIVDFHDAPYVKNQSIVIGRKGSVGTVYLTDGPFWPINTTYYVEPKGELDWIWLKELLIHLDLKSLNEATGVPGLNRDRAYSLDIAIPPLPEQQRIAEILSSVDKSIRATEAVIAQAERVKRGLMEDLLTGGLGSAAIANGEVPDGWNSTCLEDLTYKPISYGVLKPGDFCAGGTPMLRIQDFKNGWKAEDFWLISKSLDDEYKRTKVSEGDLVFSVVGTLGECKKIEKSLAGANISRALAVIGIREKALQDFVFHFLTSDFVLKWVGDTGRGGAQKVINLGDLRKLAVPVPNTEEQKRINAILSTSDDQITTNRATVEQLQRLKRGLMDDLLTGKVRTVA